MTARNTHTTTATLKLFATVNMSNEQMVKSYGLLTAVDGDLLHQ